MPHLSASLLSLTRPDHELFLQFLLDCSVIPQVNYLVQEYGKGVLEHFFECSSLHQERLRILCKWNVYKQYI